MFGGSPPPPHWPPVAGLQEGVAGGGPSECSHPRAARRKELCRGVPHNPKRALCLQSGGTSSGVKGVPRHWNHHRGGGAQTPTWREAGGGVGRLGMSTNHAPGCGGERERERELRPGEKWHEGSSAGAVMPGHCSSTGCRLAHGRSRQLGTQAQPVDSWRKPCPPRRGNLDRPRCPCARICA